MLSEGTSSAEITPGSYDLPGYGKFVSAEGEVNQAETARLREAISAYGDINILRDWRGSTEKSCYTKEGSNRLSLDKSNPN
jgi:hypothetical protein